MSLAVDDSDFWHRGGECGIDPGNELSSFDRARCALTAARPVLSEKKWAKVQPMFEMTLALTAEGELYGWGRGLWSLVGKELHDVWWKSRWAILRLGLGDDWADISAQGESACAIKKDGTLWCWGVNDSGVLGVGHPAVIPNLEEPRQVGVGEDWKSLSHSGTHACGIRGEGDVGELWCWGANRFGQLGIGSHGDDENPSAADAYEPTRVGERTDWRVVKLSKNRSCAIDQEGKLWCWGDNRNRLLKTGSQSQDEQTLPAVTINSWRWKSAALTENTICGVKDSSELWCWGSNKYGALGIGERRVDEFLHRHRFKQVGRGSDWTEVVAGEASFCARRGTDDQLWCWGRGPLGDRNIFDSPIPVTVVKHE